MKKQFTLIMLTLFLSSGLMAADLKVGVISMKKLSAEAPQAELINNRLQAIVKEPKDELDKMATELEELAKQIDKDKLMASPSQVQKMKQQYQQKGMLFKQKEAALNRGFQTAQARASAVFSEAVMAVVNEIAKQQNYDLILHEGVIFANENLDLTDQVVSVMKQDFAKQQAEEAKNAAAVDTEKK